MALRQDFVNYSIVPIILIITIILISVDNKTPLFLSIARPEFPDQCEIVNGNCLLDLYKQLLLLAAVDFLMNDHWTCFNYEHNRNN